MTSSIATHMTDKHRHCDHFFSEAEQLVNQQQWDDALTAWKQFCDELTCHLSAEEQVLFPAFEQATGMTQGPTQVMRMEHQQMRELVTQLNEAIAAHNKDLFLGLAETLMILMQQHNMKEEMMLYPMSDQHLAHTDMVEQLDRFTLA
jgi:hemerythrin-like domain-containing protein